MNSLPVLIEPSTPTEMFIEWNTGEAFAVPYLEMRYHCPCAGCIDEHTGHRTIQKDSISPTVRPTQVQLIGRYAIQVDWSDGHNTGMFHFDRLYELSKKFGRKMNPTSKAKNDASL
jgi:DUF971 family protein